MVGKFVEFYGSGVSELSLADRATIGNMAPEYGATCGIFPIDAETLRYLRLTGRSSELINLVEAYSKEQGWFHTPDSPEAEYTQTTELDLSTVEPSVAGPRRPRTGFCSHRPAPTSSSSCRACWARALLDVRSGKLFGGKVRAAIPRPMAVTNPRPRRALRPRSRSASGWMLIPTWIMDPS